MREPRESQPILRCPGVNQYSLRHWTVDMSYTFGAWHGRLSCVVSSTQSIYYNRVEDDPRNLQMVVKTTIPSEAILALCEADDKGELAEIDQADTDEASDKPDDPQHDDHTDHDHSADDHTDPTARTPVE